MSNHDDWFFQVMVNFDEVFRDEFGVCSVQFACGFICLQGPARRWRVQRRWRFFVVLRR